MRSTIAIIGGGPSGIVAAKCAIEANLMPTVYMPYLGGMWNPNHSPLWKSFRTNLSKYTCSFSDMLWNDTPMFPSQEDIFQYLNRYKDKYVSNDIFREGTMVTKVARIKENLFQVMSSNLVTKEEKIEFFESIIVANGMFGAPILGDGQLQFEGFAGTVIHSKQYLSSSQFKDRNVAIVGASFSALEVAVDLCNGNCKSVHIIQPHPTISLPRYVPVKFDSTSTSVCPLDLAFYQISPESLSVRGDRREKVFKTPVEYARSNRYLRNLLGEEVTEEFTSPSFVAISDSYLELVRSGRIVEHRGRLTKAENKELFISRDCKKETNEFSDSSTEIGEIVKEGENSISNLSENIIADVDDIILCTGFRPQLDFLDDSILANLKYDSKESFSPLILYREMMHPSEPGLYFVGMYRGPYFAVMEMQAVQKYDFFTLRKP